MELCRAASNWFQYDVEADESFDKERLKLPQARTNVAG